MPHTTIRALFYFKIYGQYYKRVRSHCYPPKTKNNIVNVVTLMVQNLNALVICVIVVKLSSNCSSLLSSILLFFPVQFKCDYSTAIIVEHVNAVSISAYKVI